MSDELEQAGLDAVNKFLDTWNGRDPNAWAASLNYPHVRPSPFGPVRVAQTKEDYIAGVDYQRVIDTGWDHSEWDYTQVLHTSPRKVHVAGQWSRYNEHGDVILTTPIVYICTLMDGNWGIQSRFGSDYADEDTDSTGFASRGLNLVQDFVTHHGSGSTAACAELLNYPHFDIGIGELNETKQPSEFRLTDVAMSIESLQALQTGLYSMNIGIELNISNGTETQLLQGIIHVNNRKPAEDREPHLGIQAWSILNPNEQTEENG